MRCYLWNDVFDAHRDDGKRFVVRANDKLTAVLQLQEAVRKNTIDIVCRRLAELTSALSSLGYSQSST